MIMKYDVFPISLWENFNGHNKAVIMVECYDDTGLSSRVFNVLNYIDLEKEVKEYLDNDVNPKLFSESIKVDNEIFGYIDDKLLVWLFKNYEMSSLTYSIGTEDFDSDSVIKLNHYEHLIDSIILASLNDFVTYPF